MRYFLLLCCLLLTAADLPAQAGAANVAPGDTSANPFDLYPTRPEPVRVLPPAVESPVAAPVAAGGGADSAVFIHLLLLLMLASLWVLFRNLLQQCFTAILNDNMMTQLYRRRSGGQISALWFCYLLFLLAAGFYLYLLLAHFGRAPGEGVWTGWLLCAMLTASLVGLKFFVLLLLGRVFPLRRELSRYTFVLMVFSILAGIVLVPLNLLVSYAPEAFRSFFLYAGGGLLVLIYLLHLIRGLFIANHYVGSRPLHFLLYICAIEIAPLLLVYRYLTLAPV